MWLTRDWLPSSKKKELHWAEEEGQTEHESLARRRGQTWWGEQTHLHHNTTVLPCLLGVNPAGTIRWLNHGWCLKNLGERHAKSEHIEISAGPQPAARASLTATRLFWGWAGKRWMILEFKRNALLLALHWCSCESLRCLMALSFMFLILNRQNK